MCKRFIALYFFITTVTEPAHSSTITLPFFNEVTFHSLTLTPVAFYSEHGGETQWKTHNHCSCLSLLALTKIIYAPGLLEVRRKRRRGQGRPGEGRSKAGFTPGDLCQRSRADWQDTADQHQEPYFILSRLYVKESGSLKLFYFWINSSK